MPVISCFSFLVRGGVGSFKALPSPAKHMTSESGSLSSHLSCVPCFCLQNPSLSSWLTQIPLAFLNGSFSRLLLLFLFSLCFLLLLVVVVFCLFLVGLLCFVFETMSHSFSKASLIPASALRVLELQAHPWCPASSKNSVTIGFGLESPQFSCTFSVFQALVLSLSSDSLKSASQSPAESTGLHLPVPSLLG